MNQLAKIMFLFLALVGPAVAEELEGAGGGIVYANNGDSMLVETPQGWILDNEAMAEQGIHMLFYPEETGFNGFSERTPVFAFVMPTYKGAPYVSVKGLIQMRTEQLKEADKLSNSIIEKSAAPDSRNASTVTIVKYSAPSVPRFERVAYLEDHRTIYAVVLSAISKEDLKKHSSFIEHVVKNHKRFISIQ
jgi:hypothetical protein